MTADPGFEFGSIETAPTFPRPGARIKVRDAEWLVRRVDPNPPGNLIESRGITGLVKGKEAIFIDLLESIKIVDPADLELVADMSPGFTDTKLHIEASFRISAPTSPSPAVTGKAAIDDLVFQHEPVKRALTQPRVRLLIADDVGLGKTLEAGLLTAELLVRRKADRILVVTTKAMLAQFQREFWARFSIPLIRLDSDAIRRARNAIPTNHNPFDQFDKAIISVDTLKNDGEYRTALESAYWDLIIIDEAHNVAARKATMGTVALRSKLARLLANRSDSLLLLTATPHDGSARSFNSLIRMLDPTAVADENEVSREEARRYLIRRFRTTPEVQNELNSKIPSRRVCRVEFDLSPQEDRAYKAVAELTLDADNHARARGAARIGAELFRTTIAKALFSSPAACLETIDKRLDRIGKGEVVGTERDVESLTSLRKEVAAIGDDGLTKYQEFVKELRTLKWDGREKRDRLLIFSERIATLRWLERRLKSDFPKLAERGIKVLDGSGAGSDVQIQGIVDEFENENSPIRILLASDIASEGLNLHFQCHRLFHFDLPWSLLTFQQRNGRIDRYGQDRQPIISYFVGRSTHSEVNDLWVLDVLVEKDEAAQKGIGDPSIFFGTNDPVEQESILTDGLERAIGARKLSEELDARSRAAPSSPEDEFAALDAMFAEFAAAPQAGPVEAGPPLPRLYESTFDFTRAMLDKLRSDGELSFNDDREYRILEFKPPEDMRERSPYGLAAKGTVDPRFMPPEAIPRSGMIRLTDQKGVIDEALRRARAAKTREWPDTQYLWDVHPIVDWLADRASLLFGREGVPLARLEGRLSKNETAVVLHGVLPNLRGAPVVDRWAVARIHGTRVDRLQEVSDFIEAVGLRGQIPNRGGADPEASMPAIRSAVRSFQDEIRRLRGDKQKSLDDASLEILGRIASLEREHLQQIEMRFESEDRRAQARKETEIGRVKALFRNWSEWFDQTRYLPDEPNPYVSVVAVFQG